MSAVAELVVPLVLVELRRGETRRACEIEYLTSAEAAERLRAKPQRIYDLVSAGRLRRYKDGARVLIKRADLEDYLATVPRERANPVLRDEPPAPRRRT